ncbi:uncharacterized protein LOC100897873 [Galendromus occidentalis]|uniref:Uncharacterized protein LOC100897873 n=1 Tax=Galendromus occidentalis TaxID=34638 RepID=A0AAJ6QPY8_9ACAR|nr:uncharacterized protein LOC100897873 [Galendromus occidentalis]
MATEENENLLKKTAAMGGTGRRLLFLQLVFCIQVNVAENDLRASIVRTRFSKQLPAGKRPHPALLSRKDQLAIVSSFAAANSGSLTTRHPAIKTNLHEDDDLYLPDQDLSVATLLDVQVQCGKNVMEITMNFDSPFNGIIYSKGHYSDLQCRYSTVGNEPNRRRFSVQGHRCGSKIVDGSKGEAFLENTVIVQHTPGIQAVTDTARALRCRFEKENITRTVSSSLSVDVLDVISVTYSGDSIDSYMDVQLGKGPFNANPVNGPVKIGETLTLVVYIHGDDYDVHVADCLAHDGDINNAIQLSNKNGCVSKPKVMGPWQKTRETSNTGASAIAWAYIEAFKFPDKLEVFLECNIEICKYQCHHDELQCLEAKKARLRRRRERIHGSNSTEKLVVRLRRQAQSGAEPEDGNAETPSDVSESAHLMRGIRVIAPEDAPEEVPGPLNTVKVLNNQNHRGGPVVIMNSSNQLCVSTTGFLFCGSLGVLLLIALLLTIGGLYLRTRQLNPEVQLMTEAAMAGTMQRRQVIASISSRAGQGAPRRKGDF